MLLISVDTAYGKNLSRAKKLAESIYKRHKISWPNVWLDDGWSEAMRRFNLGGYGLTLVGPDGIVRGLDVHDRDLDRLLKPMFKDAKSED